MWQLGSHPGRGSSGVSPGLYKHLSPLFMDIFDTLQLPEIILCLTWTERWGSIYPTLAHTYNSAHIRDHREQKSCESLPPGLESTAPPLGGLASLLQNHLLWPLMLPLTRNHWHSRTTGDVGEREHTRQESKENGVLLPSLSSSTSVISISTPRL